LVLHFVYRCVCLSGCIINAIEPGKLAVKFGFKTFVKESANYPGHDMEIAVQVASLKTVFTNRIVEEVMAYFGAFAEINSAILSARSRVAAVAAEAAKKTEASPKMKLDILVSNPKVVVPQSSFVPDHFLVCVPSLLLILC
jgi:hypothetical protein